MRYSRVGAWQRKIQRGIWNIEKYFSNKGGYKNNTATRIFMIAL